MNATTHQKATDPGLARLFGAVLVTGAVFALCASLLKGYLFGAYVGLGALASVGNLWLLARILRGFLGGAGQFAVGLLGTFEVWSPIFYCLHSDLPGVGFKWRLSCSVGARCRWV